MAMKKKNLPELVPKAFEHWQFGKIRVVKIGGNPWFVAADLCRALGYKNTRDAIAKHVDDEDKNTVTIRDGIPGNPNKVVVNESGLSALIFESQLPSTEGFCNWMTSEVLAKIDETDSSGSAVVEVQGVHGYIDDRGVAWLKIDDVARGLGFVEVKKSRVATSGDKPYEAIRWARINKYLKNFGYQPVAGSCDDIKAGDYIPENMFYRLAMKANNEAAQTFQAKIADEILPSIRRTGYYSVKEKLRYDFFHPTPEELERRLNFTTPEEIIADLDAHGIEWDEDVTAVIEPDENGNPHLVYKVKLVITDPEYEDYKKRLEAEKTAGFLPG